MMNIRKKFQARLSMWLNFLPVILLCCSAGCMFPVDPANDIPYKNERNLTGKMLYKRGAYYYHLATATHFWQGAPETNTEEFKQAGIYFSRALTKGYRPKTGYDHLWEYYNFAGDNIEVAKKQEAGYTSLIEAFPDSLKYWNSRALNRLNYKNYKGALEDLNYIVNTKRNYENLEEIYYMRGAVKYVLDQKDTTDAEADRMKALKLLETNATLDTYYVHCKVLKADMLSGDDQEGFMREKEAEDSALIKAYPDTLYHYSNRALDRHYLRNYQGALDDLNHVLQAKSTENNVKFKDDYYNRGVAKYRLNPKDTSAAEADRMIAIKLHKMYVYEEPYRWYCKDLTIPHVVLNPKMKRSNTSFF